MSRNQVLFSSKLVKNYNKKVVYSMTRQNVQTVVRVRFQSSRASNVQYVKVITITCWLVEICLQELKVLRIKAQVSAWKLKRVSVTTAFSQGTWSKLTQERSLANFPDASWSAANKLSSFIRRDSSVREVSRNSTLFQAVLGPKSQTSKQVITLLELQKNYVAL